MGKAIQPDFIPSCPNVEKTLKRNLMGQFRSRKKRRRSMREYIWRFVSLSIETSHDCFGAQPWRSFRVESAVNFEVYMVRKLMHFLMRGIQYLRLHRRWMYRDSILSLPSLQMSKSDRYSPRTWNQSSKNSGQSKIFWGFAFDKPAAELLFRGLIPGLVLARRFRTRWPVCEELGRGAEQVHGKTTCGNRNNGYEPSWESTRSCHQHSNERNTFDQ